jgi:hypothetical protein
MRAKCIITLKIFFPSAIPELYPEFFGIFFLLFFFLAIEKKGSDSTIRDKNKKTDERDRNGESSSSAYPT